MSTKTEAGSNAGAGQVERPVRPDCWGFAMEFLGAPEAQQVESYVAALEAWSDAVVAAERERCARLCERLHRGGLTGLGGPGDATAQDCADEIRQD